MNKSSVSYEVLLIIGSFESMTPPLNDGTHKKPSIKIDINPNIFDFNDVHLLILLNKIREIFEVPLFT